MKQIRAHSTSEHRSFIPWLRRLIVLLLPLFLGFSWITWVIGPVYPRYEYAKPDFPPDGGTPSLTAETRLGLALAAVSFLESWRPAEEALTTLAEQQMPLTGVPLYSQRELSHLRDVKQITDAIRVLALATAVPVSSGLLFLLRRPHTRRLGYLALGQGGLLTVMLLSSLAGLILFGWDFFFYQFHGLLFPSGSWDFAATDSLMRLYPEQFFFDVAVMMSGGTWLLGFGLMLIGYFWAWRCAQTETQKRLVPYVAKTVQ